MTGVLPNRIDRSPELREKQDIGRALTPHDVRDPVPPDTHELRLRPTHRPDRTTTPTPRRPPDTRTAHDASPGGVAGAVYASHATGSASHQPGVMG
jgi:hypothetical protein